MPTAIGYRRDLLLFNRPWEYGGKVFAMRQENLLRETRRHPHYRSLISSQWTHACLQQVSWDDREDSQPFVVHASRWQMLVRFGAEKHRDITAESRLGPPGSGRQFLFAAPWSRVLLRELYEHDWE